MHETHYPSGTTFYKDILVRLFSSSRIKTGTTCITRLGLCALVLPDRRTK